MVCPCYVPPVSVAPFSSSVLAVCRLCSGLLLGVVGWKNVCVLNMSTGSYVHFWSLPLDFVLFCEAVKENLNNKTDYEFMILKVHWYH